MLRGGSFNNNAANVRSANRNNNQPDNRNNNNGFRAASTLRQDICPVVPEFTGCPVSTVPWWSVPECKVQVVVPCRAAVRLTDERPFGQMQNRSGGSGRPQGSNAPPDHLLPYPASIGIARRIETCGDECHNGDQTDDMSDTISGLARDRQNPLDIANLSANTLTSYLTQD